MTLLEPGDLLDQYRLEELVARSGMASLFRAIDTRTGQQVALKIPHPEAECDVVFSERFEREAEIGRTLDHPAIVRILKPEKPTRVYLVFEWAEGRPLRDILAAENRLDPARAVRIALALCDALDHIHSRGIVHRDLKPENIMVDAQDGIQLLDFGIAAKSGVRRLTFGKFSNLMGTAEYISPEQVKGKRGDARSDLYALGIVLYEMVTGTAPFCGPNPLATINARLKTDAPPVRELNPNLSPQLEKILRRALERNPVRRYASARDLAWDLQHPDAILAEPCTEAAGQASERLLVYSVLAAIPVTLFLLLLLAAHNQ